MATEAHDLQSEFLKSHRPGVLATSRRSGAPHVSIIAYNFDGNDVVISTGDQSAKYKNASKRPAVSLIVIDGGKAVSAALAEAIRAVAAGAASGKSAYPPDSGPRRAPDYPLQARENLL